MFNESLLSSYKLTQETHTYHPYASIYNMCSQQFKTRLNYFDILALFDEIFACLKTVSFYRWFQGHFVASFFIQHVTKFLEQHSICCITSSFPRFAKISAERIGDVHLVFGYYSAYSALGQFTSDRWLAARRLPRKMRTKHPRSRVESRKQEAARRGPNRRARAKRVCRTWSRTKATSRQTAADRARCSFSPRRCWASWSGRRCTCSGQPFEPQLNSIELCTNSSVILCSFWT